MTDLQEILYWASGGDAAPAGQRGFDAGPARFPRVELSQFLSRWGAVAGMVAALLVIGGSAPHFFSVGNLVEVLKQGSVLALIALGLTSVLISGGFDMSAGAGSQMAANFAAGTIISGFGTAAALAVGSVAGLLVGAANALLVVLFRMQPFVATLGTMFVLMGITLFYNGGHALTIYDQPRFFFLGQGYLGPVPFVGVILALVVAVCICSSNARALGCTVCGGGKPCRCAVAWDQPSTATIGSFAIGGVVIGFSGVILASYSYGASALATGMDFLISALASAFLGSTLSRSGELSVIGATIAAIFLASLSKD